MRIVRRAFAHVLVIVFAAFLAMLAMAGNASAHAQLSSSDPPADDVVATAPDHVGLTFGDRVEAAPHAIEVFDDHLRRVDTGAATRVGTAANTLRIALRSGLVDGTYTVSWHVSSADTHPVSGTFQFSIGIRTTVTGSLSGTGRNDTAGLLLGVLRVTGYAGLVLAPGLLLVTLLLCPAELATRRTRRLLLAGLGLMSGSALGTLLLQGVWASGRSLSTLWSPAQSIGAQSHRFEALYELRFCLLLVYGLVLISVLTRAAAGASATTVQRLPRTGRVLMIGGVLSATLPLLATWSLAGHSATGPQTRIALGADVLHVLAISLWFGGLVLLTVCLRPADRVADLAATLPRFSRLAFGCVVVIVATGTYQTWREVGSLPALLHTSFGRVLLVKLAAVLGVLMLGNLARRWVLRHLGSGLRLPRVMPGPIVAHAYEGAAPTRAGEEPGPSFGPAEVRRLRRGLTLEMLLGVVVLAFTAALVVSVPGRESYVKPFHQTVAAPSLTVAVRIDKPRTGDAVLRLQATTGDGRPVAITGLRGALTLASAGLGPLPLRLATPTGAAADGQEAIGLTFPRPGRWNVAVTVQTSPTDAVSYSFTVPVH